MEPHEKRLIVKTNKLERSELIKYTEELRAALRRVLCIPPKNIPEWMQKNTELVAGLNQSTREYICRKNGRLEEMIRQGQAIQ